jgi:short-subunit dehydrogenase
MPRPVALITGPTSGLGAGLARRYAIDGYDLVLVARNVERLERLAAELHDEAGATVEVLPADLAEAADRAKVADRLSAGVRVLVNNAGFGTHGFFHETDLQRELEMINVNCAAPVHLTKRLLPWMLERRKGYVVNVASLSAFTPGPVMAMYFATKAFLLSFSEALWEECRDTGVSVLALCPGSVKTEFQGAAGISPKARTSGTVPLPVERVVDDALRGLFEGKRVVIPGYQALIAAMLSRFTPKGRALKTVRRIQEERRRQSREP